MKRWIAAAAAAAGSCDTLFLQKMTILQRQTSICSRFPVIPTLACVVLSLLLLLYCSLNPQSNFTRIGSNKITC